jgi:hypothetical protein
MKKTHTLALALCAAALAAFSACGGNGSNSDFHLGAGGSGGGSGGSGSGSGGSLLGDDGGGPGSGILGDAACATASAGASLVPVMLVFMFDRSGSMDQQSKWTSCSQGLTAFFSDANSKGLLASLQFFEQPDQCNVTAYAAPLVPMTPLPSGNFAGPIAATSPQGETPTLPALQGALQYAAQEQKINPTAKVAVVLVTDGDPNACNSTIQAVSGAAQAAAASIPTYVIGIGNVTNLDMIAAAGGTKTAFIVSTTNPQQTVADFQKALSTIKGSALSCEYTVPAAPQGQSIDFNKINVVYTSSSGAQTVLPYNKDCSGNGQGWHYDNPASPTKIEICPGSCTSIMADTGAKIDVELGCDTLGGVQ